MNMNVTGAVTVAAKPTFRCPHLSTVGPRSVTCGRCGPLTPELGNIPPASTGGSK